MSAVAEILKSRRALEIIAVLSRWAIGLLFIYMGFNKAMDPVGFLKLVRQYDLVQTPWLLNSIAAMLPWFEVFCGFLLLSGIAVRGAALVGLLMLIPFTIVVFKRALALQAVQHIPFCSIRFDCGCGAGEVWICAKLLENTILILLSGWLLTGYGRALTLRYCLLGRGRSAANPLPEAQEV